ncbi:MAG: squalene synthase HpnC [Thermoguttaceae bacterium]
MGGNKKVLQYSISEAEAYCEKLARSHYENFSVASFLLPKKLRKPFFAVYAYCRVSDDLADESGSTEAATNNLSDWESELDRCFAGEKIQHPVFIALRQIINEFELTKEPFSNLLVAFKRDQFQTRYANFDELLDYCRYSANPVGRIILRLGCALERHNNDSQPEMQQYSDAICTGLQLANFWQDVARDWKIGRFYVPLDVCEKFNCEPLPISKWKNSVDEEKNKELFREMMKFLVNDAKKRFEFGKPLVKIAPRCLRVDISLFINGGLAILKAIERINYDVWNSRPVVSKWQKIKLLLKAFIQ